MLNPRTHLRALTRALVCLVIAAGLAVLSAPSASAEPPTGLTPAAGAQVSGIPTLAWERSSATAKYDVQLSTSSAFTTTLDSVTATVNDQYVPDVQLPNGTVYWRVRVNGSADPWTTADFVSENVAAPVMTGPDDAVVLQQPQAAPVLSWQPVPGADSYEVQYGTDPNFVDLTEAETTDSSSFVVGLQAPGTYVWRVRGVLASGIFTAWSSSRSYTVAGLAAPVRQSPPNDVNHTLRDVVLDWAPVPGAKSYDLQIGTDSNFLTVVETRSTILGTRYSPPGTLNNDQYYWRVRPTDAAGNKPDWSEVPTWAFSRSWPDQAQPEYPADGATVGDPFYFEWTPVELASKYTIQLSPNPSFAPSSVVKQCTTVHTTFTPKDDSACMPQAVGTYWWRILATDEFGAEAPITDVISAPTRSFTYYPDLPDPVSPADGATITVPTVSWQPVSGASKYRVTFTSSTGGTVSKDTTTTSYTPASLAVGSWTWEVRTLSEHGDLGPGLTADSEPQFDLVAPPTPDEAQTVPNPSPASVAPSYRPPTLQWTPVFGAGHYKVQIRRTGTLLWTLLPANYKFPAGEDTDTANLSPGEYEWRVSAYSTTGGHLSTGAAGTFTLASLPAVPVMSYRAAISGTDITEHGSAPYVCDATLPASCQNLRQTPVLSWDSPSDHVGYYRLVISRDAELTNVVKTVDVTSSMWIDEAALPDSQAGSAYFWTVLPCTTAGFCLPPQHADHSFNKQSRQLTLVSPAHGAVVQNDVTFTWDDYLASQALVEGADPDTGTPLDTPAQTEAREYRIQTSTDPNFVVGVTTTSVDQRTFTSFTDTYPEGTNYWRVQAVDGSGNQLAWSQVRSFVKQSPTPVLSLPTEGQSVPGDSTLSWQPLDFASSYVVEVYRNNDLVPNPANRVVNATTNRVSYVLGSLDPSRGPYTWRVRREDAKSRDGAWSALRSFSVSQPAPALLAPGPDVLVEPSDAVFTWQALPSATTYRFERRAAGATSIAENVTTPALARATTAAIPGGSWEWRVTALNTAGHALGASAWRPFSVVDTPSATTPVSISGSGAIDTPLTVNPPTWNMPADTVTTTYQWYRSGTLVAGQTGTTYNVTSADIDKAITVRATGTRPGYKTGTSTSNAITGAAGPAITASGSPSFTGVPAAGETLTANPGSWPGSPTYTYQWFVDGLAVARETRPSYVVRTRDAGLPVAVRVTATTPGYQPGSALSGSQTVAKLASTTAAKLKSNKISRRSRAVLTVTVGVKDLGSPLGQVQVKDGSKQIALVTLGNTSNGTLTLRLKKLPPGKHKISVAYLGSAATKPSSAPRLKLVVTR